jgi:hypothetical protein
MCGIVMNQHKIEKEIKIKELKEIKEIVKLPAFNCNVNYNNIEYKKGEEWKNGKIPKELEQFLN